jgi:hypothetical protein
MAAAGCPYPSQRLLACPPACGKGKGESGDQSRHPGGEVNPTERRKSNDVTDELAGVRYPSLLGLSR